MKRILLFATCAYFICASALAQSFEGTITYINSYKSKVPAMTDEQIGAMMGANQTYKIKGGNYHSSLDGSLMQWQLYRADENRIYMKLSSTSAVFWKDASENPDEVQEAVLNKKVEKVLGYTCDELVLTCKSGVQKYYFHSSVGVDPSIFTNHKFGNFSEMISRTKALPLKAVIETQQFTIVTIATEVKPEKVSDEVFKFPEGVNLQKSPY